MITTRSEHACHGGKVGFYSHRSRQTGTEMRFGVFVPPAAVDGPVPALYFLAGLTCTEETFLVKAGAQRLAAELGVMLVTCDTSPRGLQLPGEDDDWDFGSGAGFYLDATQPPWARHYRMGSYVNEELPALIEQQFPARRDIRGVFGHSMGGHGALVTALRNPERWKSVSALAPICHPSTVPWGEKAFTHYLGQNRADWMQWDAGALMQARPYPGEILIDQGLADQFLDSQLRPQALEAVAATVGQKLRLRLHDNYDHSYWFIQSFVDDHLRHHAAILSAP
jgi:S-formylglutathione hydrolase